MPDQTLSETTRVEAFSDGVFAIAITLLILEIRVPPPAVSDTMGGLQHALLALWPSYVGYAISFIAIGIMWTNHHAMFTYILRSDRYFLMINVVLLMFVAFVPFPAGLLAAYLAKEPGRTAAVAAYSTTILIIAIAFNALWWYAIKGGRLLDPNADRVAVRTLTRRSALGPLAYAIALALAFVSAWGCLALHAALAVFYLLPEKRAAAKSI